MTICFNEMALRYMTREKARETILFAVHYSNYKLFPCCLFVFPIINLQPAGANLITFYWRGIGIKKKKTDGMPFVIEFCTPDAVLELPIHSLGNSINLRPLLVWRRTAQHIQDEPPSSGQTASPR